MPRFVRLPREWRERYVPASPRARRILCKSLASSPFQPQAMLTPSSPLRTSRMCRLDTRINPKHALTNLDPSAFMGSSQHGCRRRVNNRNIVHAAIKPNSKQSSTVRCRDIPIKCRPRCYGSVSIRALATGIGAGLRTAWRSCSHLADAGSTAARLRSVSRGARRRSAYPSLTLSNFT